MKNKLVLLRHGQSVWNLENKFTGWKDVDLTEKGEKEAAEAGKLIGDLEFDIVFTSKLKRARKTAHIALKNASSGKKFLTSDGFDHIEAEALNERDYGDLMGMNKDQVKEKYGKDQVHIWRRSFDVPPPGGECLADVVKRVEPYYKQEIEPRLKEGQNILIVAHGNSLRALLMVLGLEAEENISTVEIPTGKPMLIQCEGSTIIDRSFLT